jgi:hypothetical protein
MIAGDREILMPPEQADRAVRVAAILGVDLLHDPRLIGGDTLMRERLLETRCPAEIGSFLPYRPQSGEVAYNHAAPSSSAGNCPQCSGDGRSLTQPVTVASEARKASPRQVRRETG